MQSIAAVEAKAMRGRPAASSTSGGEVVKGGVRWLGWSDPEAMRSAAAPVVLGSAHGPRLLELLKTAC